jgi:hypothetical protein
MSSRLTIVLSQAPGKHPAKRALEESIVAALLGAPGIDVSVIPHLYDLGPDHTGRLYLESVGGDLVVLNWLYPRAAFWLLDRIGVKGRFGESQLRPVDADEDVDDSPEPPKGIGPAGDIPDRFIYCLDLRDSNQYDAYIREIQRIGAECRSRRANKTNGQTTLVQLGLPDPSGARQPAPAFSAEQLLAAPDRRWYPVIDYSRCTNCLECLDFCLFGVYGVDGGDRILVENQDQCKRGCPACSRVCPEQAIMFPDFKSAAIAGAPVGAVGSLKIDLTKLFGGDVKDPLAQAVAERDRELVADGREAVGATVGIPKRQLGKPEGPKDDIDRLMDDLDRLDI